jgi:hypothetical protein
MSDVHNCEVTPGVLWLEAQKKGLPTEKSIPYESSIRRKHPNTPGAPSTKAYPPGRFRAILRAQYPNLGLTPSVNARFSWYGSLR